MPVRVFIASFLLLSAAAICHAQTGRTPSIEGIAGHAAFLDEDPVDHVIAGAALRYTLSPRVSIGPEIVYMRGPDLDRDLFLTGDVWFDFLAPGPYGPRPVTPYLVAGAGLMRHTDRFTPDFTAYEFAVTGGLGLRIRLTDRWYIAPEGRLGWEPHSRFSASIGYTFDR
jgi:hypothetical protein